MSTGDDFVSDINKLMKEERRKQDPDYSNNVYCDKHLGVKMLLVESWGSTEYGDTSVDANPIYLWSCPKPNCDRRYEPTMFGYHSNELGRRIQRDEKNQHRGNHLGLPFMYIGKIGDGRGYKCPLYKCNEVGPIVAEIVVNEEVQVPSDPLAKLKRAERKRALELMVFRSFAVASGLPIDSGSPESRDPDYPDIACTISGQRYWFELTQIIHKDVAEKVNPRRRRLETGFSYDQERPFVDLITSKASKKVLDRGCARRSVTPLRSPFRHCGHCSTTLRQARCDSGEPDQCRAVQTTLGV